MTKKITKTAKATKASETRALTMHPNLLKDIVFKQAGTREKAILEGVMNSVDAEATKIDIQLTQQGLMIEDNGHGFQTRDNIIANFEMFGTPHEEGDATYGRFRMGRGQLFAKGTNVWRSRTFSMEVDAKEALEYHLTERLPDFEGCRIEVKWYEPLLPSEQHEIARALRRMVRFVDIPILLNGTRITDALKEQTWDLQTDEAYFKFNKTGSLAVYNLGVLVSDYPNSRFGVGGLAVSKQRLDVNFARNDVMGDCRNWKKITKVLRDHSDQEITKRARVELSDGERERACTLFMAGELPWKDASRLRLFTDCTGGHWSLKSLFNWQRANGWLVTSAPAGDRMGDSLLQHRRAFVFDEEMWARFGVNSEAEFVKVCKRADSSRRMSSPLLQYYETTVIAQSWQPVSFGDLAQDIDSRLLLIKPEDYTPTQNLMLRVLDEAQKQLVRHRWATINDQHKPEPRKLVWGESETADAWTDGKTFVALNVGLIPKTLDMKVSHWVTFGINLIHEYAHQDGTMSGHVHGADFYHRHDELLESLGEFVHTCVYIYIHKLEQEQRVVKKEAGRLMDRLAKAGVLEKDVKNLWEAKQLLAARAKK